MKRLRLAFKYVLKPKREQKEILEELMWHCIKVYNTLNYEIRQGKQKIKKEV